MTPMCRQPSGTVVVSHVYDQDHHVSFPDVSCADSQSPSPIRTFTPSTCTSSQAFPVTSIVPLTVDPWSGVLMTRCGNSSANATGAKLTIRTNARAPMGNRPLMDPPPGRRVGGYLGSLERDFPSILNDWCTPARSGVARSPLGLVALPQGSREDAEAHAVVLEPHVPVLPELPHVVQGELLAHAQQTGDVPHGHARDLLDVLQDPLLDLVQAAAVLRDRHVRGIVEALRALRRAMDHAFALEHGQVVREFPVRESEVPLDVRVAVPRVHADLPPDHPARLLVHDGGRLQAHV